MKRKAVHRLLISGTIFFALNLGGCVESSQKPLVNSNASLKFDDFREFNKDEKFHISHTLAEHADIAVLTACKKNLENFISNLDVEGRERYIVCYDLYAKLFTAFNKRLESILENPKSSSLNGEVDKNRVKSFELVFDLIPALIVAHKRLKFDSSLLYAHGCTPHQSACWIDRLKEIEIGLERMCGQLSSSQFETWQVPNCATYPKYTDIITVDFRTLFQGLSSAKDENCNLHPPNDGHDLNRTAFFRSKIFDKCYEQYANMFVNIVILFEDYLMNLNAESKVEPRLSEPFANEFKLYLDGIGADIKDVRETIEGIDKAILSLASARKSLKAIDAHMGCGPSNVLCVSFSDGGVAESLRETCRYLTSLAEVSEYLKVTCDKFIEE